MFWRYFDMEDKKYENKIDNFAARRIDWLIEDGLSVDAAHLLVLGKGD